MPVDPCERSRRPTREAPWLRGPTAARLGRGLAGAAAYAGMVAGGALCGAYALHNPRNSPRLGGDDLPGMAIGALAMPTVYALGKRSFGRAPAALAAMALGTNLVWANYASPRHRR